MTIEQLVLSPVLFWIFPRCPKPPFLCPSQFSKLSMFQYKMKTGCFAMWTISWKQQKAIGIDGKALARWREYAGRKTVPGRLNKLGKCKNPVASLLLLPCMISEKGYSPQDQLSGLSLAAVLLWHWECAVASYDYREMLHKPKKSQTNSKWKKESIKQLILLEKVLAFPCICHNFLW